MRISTRFIIFVDRFKRNVRRGLNSGLHKTAALIRLEARQSLRIRKKPSLPGNPPSAHTRAGLREINYSVVGLGAYIGPRKFRKRNRLNRPAPNVHEFGGIAIQSGTRGQKAFLKRYPERSFMYRAVKTLQRKGKLNSQFKYSVGG
jgi:hypothetical protein